MEIKPFLITICPICETRLKVEKGQKEDVIKLICPNPNCDGSFIKRLQKGIKILEIKGLGPALIEKLYETGISSSVDIFNPEKFNQQLLINSGEFKDGKTLENLLQAVNNTKEIPIDKAILSLQLMIPKNDGTGQISIGKSLSEQIGKMLSEVPYSFENLSIQIREEIQDKNSELYILIINKLKEFESFGVKIKYYEKITKPKEIKKIIKNTFIQDEPTSLNMTKEELIKNLSWNLVEFENETCDILIVEDPNKGDYIEEAKKRNMKILSFKQIKLLYL